MALPEGAGDVEALTATGLGVSKLWYPAFAHCPCPQTLAAVLSALNQSSPAELTISALSLALLVPVKELNVRFRDRLPTPIPGEVVMVRAALDPSPQLCPDPHYPVGSGGYRPLVDFTEVTSERYQ